MPKGQAAVRWTAELDGKLLLTIIAVQNIQIDYDAVAKAFGKSSPVEAHELGYESIHSRSKRMELERSPSF